MVVGSFEMTPSGEDRERQLTGGVRFRIDPESALILQRETRIVRNIYEVGQRLPV